MVANEARMRIAELEEALRIIALRSHEVVLTEPVDWRDVANTFVSVARNALDGPHADTRKAMLAQAEAEGWPIYPTENPSS